MCFSENSKLASQAQEYQQTAKSSKNRGDTIISLRESRSPCPERILFLVFCSVESLEAVTKMLQEEKRQLQRKLAESEVSEMTLLRFIFPRFFFSFVSLSYFFLSVVLSLPLPLPAYLSHHLSCAHSALSVATALAHTSMQCLGKSTKLQSLSLFSVCICGLQFARFSVMGCVERRVVFRSHLFASGVVSLVQQ